MGPLAVLCCFGPSMLELLWQQPCNHQSLLLHARFKYQYMAGWCCCTDSCMVYAAAYLRVLIASLLDVVKWLASWTNLLVIRLLYYRYYTLMKRQGQASSLMTIGKNNVSTGQPSVPPATTLLWITWEFW